MDTRQVKRIAGCEVEVGSDGEREGGEGEVR